MAANVGNWQQNLDDFLNHSLNSGCLESFGCLKTVRERIKFIFNQNLIQNVEWLKVYLDNCDLIHTKSSEKAAKCKNNGNIHFKKRNYGNAIEFYTESVLLSPVNNGNDLALAYGNRSAALYHLCKYEECLTDIERAVESGFPEESLYKLYTRRIQCRLQLNDFQHAGYELESTLTFINSQKDKIESKKFESVMKEIEGLQKTLHNKSESLTETKKTAQLKEHVVSYGTNDILTQASNCIDMRYTKEQGRYLTTNREIEVGDTLIVEKPFSSVLLPDHYKTHCHHCYHKLPLNLVGCIQCSVVRYCSSKCQEESWKLYHSVECPYLDLLHSVGIAHLSLRTVLTAGLQFLTDFIKERKDDESKKTANSRLPGLNERGKYERSYDTVYYLMTHDNDILTEDMYQYSGTAALLLIILVHSGWFNTNVTQIATHIDSTLQADLQSVEIDDKGGTIYANEGKDADIANDSKDNSLTNQKKQNNSISTNEKSMESNIDGLLTNGKTEACQSSSNKTSFCGVLTNEMLDIGGLLLRHIEQLVCNAHAITEVQCTDTINDSMILDTSQVRIATAIYPTASLMNHSCDPTIISSFHGDTLIVKSVKKVLEGEEIYNCYGPHHKRMVRKRRQEVLENQYFFHCKCPPCCEERAGDIKFNAAICNSCTGIIDTTSELPQCLDCGQTEDTASKEIRQQIEGLLHQGVTSLLQHSNTQAFKYTRLVMFLHQGVTSLLQHSNTQEALKFLLLCYKLCCKHLHEYNVIRASVDDSLARGYTVQGDHIKAVHHLQDSIKVTEAMYGSDSIEVGHELQKLADILFNAQRAEEALRVLHRAIYIFTAHYGEFHDTVKELIEMKDCLIDFIGAEKIKDIVL
ncbi:hypothetical protein LOTGIDRAFT_169490 [Lottia gigantea]|uniref:Protein-lysine N-methyltransferase SMYD4 n=1 Tax=Lottia gigantea TaxID=225164 RepID=V3YYP9_LOTGI|nr:hypothetical protein LOTGIDRAFT_169490 [Lottia gigantea]ESO83273.1 hypothetical protein LOTGIDRAFT_169490 [Lottia gigantea]